jgi:hypothetical protein
LLSQEGRRATIAAGYRSSRRAVRSVATAWLRTFGMPAAKRRKGIAGFIAESLSILLSPRRWSRAYARPINRPCTRHRSCRRRVRLLSMPTARPAAPRRAAPRSHHRVQPTTPSAHSPLLMLPAFEHCQFDSVKNQSTSHSAQGRLRDAMGGEQWLPARFDEFRSRSTAS